MRLVGARYILLVLLVNFSIVPTHLLAQSEKGLLPIFNFSPKTYLADNQNFAVLQDQRGVMYFGNNRGILEYDGVGWTLIDANESVIRSLAIDNKGRIYVGGIDEFGYLASDSIGNLRYNSLISLLDEDYQYFGDVWKTFATEDGIIFQTYDYIFIYNDSISVILPQTSFREAYYVNNALYVRQYDLGLTCLEDGVIKPVEGGERFSDEQIWGMVPLENLDILVATAHELLSMKTDDGQNNSTSIQKIHSEADPYFNQYDINSILQIDNSSYSIGTWGGGIVLINRDGEILDILDKISGLGDDIVQHQLLDDRNNLWLALSHGIARVEILSPLTSFGDASGLTGTIQAITRFNNTIYVATIAGLYYLTAETATADQDEVFSKPRFVLLDDLAFECWGLEIFSYDGEELLLVVNNDAIRAVDSHNRISEVLVPDDYTYEVYQSKLVPRRVYIGLETGLASVYRDKGVWIDEGRIEGIEENIDQMSEDMIGNLWMGTPSQGVIKLNILSLDGDQMKEVKVSKFDTAFGLPEGPTIVSQITGPAVVATTEGLFIYNQVENSFKPDTSYGMQFADGSHYIHRISENREKGIWVVTYIAEPEQPEDEFKAGYLESLDNDRFQWITEPFIRITEENLFDIYVDEQNVTWLGGNSLYRYDMANDKDYKQSFNTLIRKVTLGSDSLIFGGANFDRKGMTVLDQPSQLFYSLKYRYNSLIFDYAAPSGEDESFLKFSYFLEGFDDGWSNWSGQTLKEYTNLREGSYTFRVKAKNVYNHEGEEATFTFSVLPPWYRTIFAYIGYVVFFVVFVYTVVRVYSRQLRAIIRERTAEVVMQKEEIEMKNQEITDSIHYASRIQTAILPPVDYAQKILADKFILYLPRDIVSGDFFWLHELDSKLITVASDCTGHGVPGAFMSMLGVAFLNEIVSTVDSIQAHEILNQLRDHVIKSLHQTGAEGESKDGMDIALCIYDLQNMKLEFAGANNPLYLIRDEELITYKGDKMPIGIHQLADESFTLNEIDLKKGDIMYTFSDGYADQFGGPKGKKFMSKKMKELFLEIHKLDMDVQKKILKDSLYNWMENHEQVDDVIVMGVRV